MRDVFSAFRELRTHAGTVGFYSLPAVAEAAGTALTDLPYALRVLLEALVRQEDGARITADHVRRLASLAPDAPKRPEIPFLPARVLLQDFTGVPAVVDLAAMRAAMARNGADPGRVNPQIPVDLIIDHSIQVDVAARPDALEQNTRLEFQRNRERYEFLRWGQAAFRNLRVVPPSSGICHQINLEHLARVVRTREIEGRTVAFPDSLVGTDSHTPMINGLGVVGWGVGGIEAEAMMLGQPIYMLVPRVIGVRLVGTLPEGSTATDAVLAVTAKLREHGVVGCFVEYFGPGLDGLAVPDRATLANMTPEYGATMGYFPVDGRTLEFLRATGRPAELVDLVERYAKEQGLFRAPGAPEPAYAAVVTLDLSAVEPCMAGPNRPQDRVVLSGFKAAWRDTLRRPPEARGLGLSEAACSARIPVRLESGQTVELGHGSVVIAAITSCTNTSNPAVMVAAGLLARKAAAAGLRSKPWVKTSLAPGSRVVTRYLEKAGLLPALEQLGFHVVGYGCMTCIGNSGPLPESIVRAVRDQGLVAAAVLSGNRNFEGRVSPWVRAAYLASPPLVVAYGLAGTLDIDLAREPLGTDPDGRAVFLKDLWPSSAEIAAALAGAVAQEDFEKIYETVERGDDLWAGIRVGNAPLFDWRSDSTYVREPPFFQDVTADTPPFPKIRGARVLAKLGDSITTDHISPAGAIPPDSPAGRYLQARGVPPEQFNSYGSRRGNHEVMMRGTFANIRLRNQLAPGAEGGWTTHFPSGERLTIFDAAERYRQSETPVIVLAGKDYGMGSSRDWAAKGPALLGVRAVIAQSFERIHRSNLVGMGILPLEFADGETAASLGLTGRERYSIHLPENVGPGDRIRVEVAPDHGPTRTFSARLRLDSPMEIAYYRNGGILQTVLRRMLRAPGA